MTRQTETKTTFDAYDMRLMEEAEGEGMIDRREDTIRVRMMSQERRSIETGTVQS